jgi:hypothetical protein
MITIKKTTYWHKLDNAAKIFPAVSNHNRSNVFRLSFYLDEEIDVDFLEHAVKLSLDRFQTFAVQLKSGLFWNYFAENKKPFKVEKEPPQICKYFKFAQNNDYLFKVYYLNNKVSLETFHSITDGTGAIIFLKTIVFKYYTLKGYTLEHENKILGELPYSNRESVDAFVRNYDSNNKKQLKEVKAYHLKGEKFKDDWNLLIKLQVPSDQFLNMCREKYKVSVTQYITALIAYAYYQEGTNAKGNKNPIKMLVPVNLRPYFDEITLRNFALYIKATYDLQHDWTFEEMLEFTKNEFFEQLTKEQLQQRLSALVGIEKNIFVRILPLFLKTIAFKIGYKQLAESISTMSLSNLGNVDLPTDLKLRIKDVDFITAGKDINCSICSVHNHININLISELKDISTIRYVVNHLRSEGIDLVIDTNYQEGYDEIL